MTDYNHMSNNTTEAIGVTREEFDKTLQPKRVFIAFYKNVKNSKRKLAFLREARVFEIIDNKPSFVLSFEYSAGMSMGEDTEIMYQLIDAGIIKDKKEGYYFDKERDYHIYCLN